MFKRVRWMGMGAVAGVGAAAWAQRRLHQTLEDHPSVRSGAELASAARRLGREVRAALVDGRLAMAEREAALRAGLGGRRRVDGGTDAALAGAYRSRRRPALRAGAGSKPAAALDEGDGPGAGPSQRPAHDMAGHPALDLVARAGSDLTAPRGGEEGPQVARPRLRVVDATSRIPRPARRGAASGPDPAARGPVEAGRGPAVPSGTRRRSGRRGRPR